jgi:hypothetical protein
MYPAEPLVGGRVESPQLLADKATESLKSGQPVKFTAEETTCAPAFVERATTKAFNSSIISVERSTISGSQ